MSVDALFTRFFSEIHDNRQPAKISYPFYDVLFLTLTIPSYERGVARLLRYDRHP